MSVRLKDRAYQIATGTFLTECFTSEQLMTITVADYLWDSASGLSDETVLQVIEDLAEEIYKVLQQIPTYSSYSFGKNSLVIDTLIPYDQEEHMVTMAEVIELLKESEEFSELQKETDLSCKDCLLIRSW